MEHIDYIWVNEKFEQLERLSKAILVKVEGYCEPDLVTAWQRMKVEIRKVDIKVPDKQPKKQKEPK